MSRTNAMDEADHLVALLYACHRVLPYLSNERQDDLATALRETCRMAEARLRELGVGYEQALYPEEQFSSVFAGLSYGSPLDRHVMRL